MNRSTHDITYVVEKIKAAKLPVILPGMRASTNEVTKAVRALIADTELPVVETYQAAGAISRELEDHSSAALACSVTNQVIFY